MSAEETEGQPEKKGWLSRLRAGLSRSSSKLVGGITGLFTKKKLDDDLLEQLEDLLITADLGVATAAKLTANLAREKFDKEVTEEEVRESFAADIAEMLEPAVSPLVRDTSQKPHIVLVVGVNGGGKTTTIGKLAKRFGEDGAKVMMAAGDTFRAAAIEQLQVWGERTGCKVIARPHGSDSAALAFDAVETAKREGADMLLIDTAGRLQNKSDLMDELAKLIRVIRKIDPSAPHDCVLVLDGTVGQNAHGQVKAFKEMVEVSGLIVTKLDGSAKGGVVVALTEAFGLPVHAVGVGEGVDDLRPFEPKDFARGLMGLS